MQYLKPSAKAQLLKDKLGFQAHKSDFRVPKNKMRNAQELISVSVVAFGEVKYP